MLYNMVRKATTDKSHRQNVKQNVNVKVNIGDYKKKGKAKKARRKRSGGSGGGDDNKRNPYAQSFNPVYIQSGTAPHLEPQSNNSLLSTVQDMAKDIKRNHEEIVRHPLTRVHFNTPEQSVLNVSDFKTPQSRGVSDNKSPESSGESDNNNRLQNLADSPTKNDTMNSTDINSFKSSMTRGIEISPITLTTPHKVSNRGRASSFDIPIFSRNKTPQQSTIQQLITEVGRGRFDNNFPTTPSVANNEVSRLTNNEVTTPSVSFNDVYPTSLVQDRIAFIEGNNPLYKNKTPSPSPPPPPKNSNKPPLHVTNPDDYILNPTTGRSVKRSGPTGQKVLEEARKKS